MDDKFILMGFNEAGDIAEILKNKTCKKILDYLVDRREASEKDIADGLGMAINTVEYNLKKLIGSGLIKKTSNFFWSVKGKKIPMYKLAKKHIIISSGRKPSMDVLKNILPVVLIALVLVSLAGLFMFPGQEGDEINQDQTKLRQFGSLSELTEFLKENSEDNYWGGNFRNVGMDESFSIPSVGVESQAVNKAGGESVDSQSSSDYSETNIQVEGVDEADIVKNDGKYIYVVSGNKVFIIDAYPAENMNVLSEIEFNGSISEIFINEDKLIVFGNSYSYSVEEKGMIAEDVRCLRGGCEYSSYKNVIYIYNIKDRRNPELDLRIENDDNYVDSRMIGDYVYVISNKYVNINNPEVPVYWVEGVKEDIGMSEIYYFDYPDNNYVFTSVMAMNIKDGDFNKKVYLTGGSSNVYVSEKNIYLSYQKRMNYEEYLGDYVNKVGFSVLPSDKDEEVEEILDLDKKDYEKLARIRSIIYDYSLNLKGSEKAEFDEKLIKLEEEFEIEIMKKIEKTIIHKIGVDKENIEYKSVGEVPGNILNQFSMDEYECYLRVAVTTGNSWRDNSLNHVYVLDKDLEIVGSVEDLAKSERIYSARFINDKVYLVTFKQVDPLFVIDLSDVENPEVLGYLKVTGYSSYLHAYDENHIIGIGKEADENGRTRGVKIALFDVSDFENPKEISKYEIGAEWSEKYRWSDSEALNEHKAFLFDKEKELLVIPVSCTRYFGEGYGDREYWQGAYVFKINLNEIDLKGRVSHFEGNESYWNSNVRRSLYMDDVLYTISNFKVKANELSDLSFVSGVEIGDEEENKIFYAQRFEMGVSEDRGVGVY